jgi:hypothetical protein
MLLAIFALPRNTSTFAPGLLVRIGSFAFWIARQALAVAGGLFLLYVLTIVALALISLVGRERVTS